MPTWDSCDFCLRTNVGLAFARWEGMSGAGIRVASPKAKSGRSASHCMYV